VSASSAQWHADQKRYGWIMPPAPRWKRLPVIRYFRFVWHNFNIRRHNAMWGSLGMVPSGYDEWVLYGVARGWERPMSVKEIGRASSGTDQRSTGPRELLSPEPRQVSANNRGNNFERCKHGVRFENRCFACDKDPPSVDPLCMDCPPVGYPTDTTRCTSCPRHVVDP
jgi:hypothetical protein